MSLTAAETHEVTQLDTAHRKIYVLDTNVPVSYTHLTLPTKA